MRFRAFTLIEILVVIAIIAVLAALSIAGMNHVRDAARAARTIQRIEDATTALAQCGTAEVSAALRLHRDIIRPELLRLGRRTGVLQWASSSMGGERAPINNWTTPTAPYVPGPLDTTVAARDGNWLDLHDATDPGWCWTLPWGPKPIQLWLSMPPGTEANNVQTASQAHPANQALLDILQHRHLGLLNPEMTPQLLRLAGVIDAESEWATDRSPQRSWNDAWGNPLVLGLAFYQPTMSPVPLTCRDWANNLITTPIDGYSRYVDKNLVACMEAYGYERAVYLAGASAGPTLVASLTGSAAASDLRADARTVWQQATDIVGASSWTSDSWAQPPWTGVRKVRSSSDRRLHAFIAAPTEVR